MSDSLAKAMKESVEKKKVLTYTSHDINLRTL